MIYQPRRGKTIIFERILTVHVHIVPSGRTMKLDYLCLCCTYGNRYRVIRCQRVEPKKVYYDRPIYEDLMSLNARLN